jgi:hypothetical protein
MRFFMLGAAAIVFAFSFFGFFFSRFPRCSPLAMMQYSDMGSVGSAYHGIAVAVISATDPQSQESPVLKCCPA